MTRGVCWYCHYGWPEAVVAIYYAHVERAGEDAMHYGAAHVVWDDENFDRASVQRCVERCEKESDTFTPAEVAAVRDSLVALLALPEAVRVPRPDYDCTQHDAEDYPPPDDLPMTRRVDVP